LTGAGLPRRVRRTAPAPERSAAGGPAGHPEPEPAPELDAEELRSKLAALQRGWRRGREQTEEPARGEAPPGPNQETPARPAHPPTPARPAHAPHNPSHSPNPSNP
ncbi:hypothetical protein, partial [Streptomyces triticirhizae]